jgi:hypothetical protein
MAELSFTQYITRNKEITDRFEEYLNCIIQSMKKADAYVIVDTSRNDLFLFRFNGVDFFVDFKVDFQVDPHEQLEATGEIRYGLVEKKEDGYRRFEPKRKVILDKYGILDKEIVNPTDRIAAIKFHNTVLQEIIEEMEKPVDLKTEKTKKTLKKQKTKKI